MEEVAVVNGRSKDEKGEPEWGKQAAQGQQWHQKHQRPARTGYRERVGVRGK